jgi:large subunit ribosomal protein L9
LRQLEEDLKQRAHKIAKLKADAEEFVKTLEGVKLTISAKAAANGSIYGSVNNIQIANALEALGHNVDRKIIFLNENVKELGSYKATVKPHKEVSIEIDFDVVAE